MLRQLFTTHHNGQNTSSWTVGLPILGVLAFVFLFTTDIATAARLAKHGTANNLPQVWVEVVARDLDYINPQGPWVSVSVHEFEIINYHNFEVRFDHEFQHWVVEVDGQGKEGDTVVDPPARLVENQKLTGPGTDFNGGVMTGDCNGLIAGTRSKPILVSMLGKQDRPGNLMTGKFPNHIRLQLDKGEAPLNSSE